MNNNNPRLSAQARVPQPFLTAKRSEQVEKYLKAEARRERFQKISQALIIFIGAILHGLAMTLICFSLGYFFINPFGKMIAESMFEILVNYPQALLPHALRSYASWIVLGPPAVVISGQFIYGYFTDTLGFSSKASLWLKSFFNYFGHGLPFLAFIGGLSFGLPLTTVLLSTWGAGFVSCLYLISEKSLWATLTPHVESANDTMQAQQHDEPNLRRRPSLPIQQQQDNLPEQGNTYLPSQRLQRREREPLPAPDNQEARETHTLPARPNPL
ncbi:MAG: hypothetical protein JSS07_07860 [Proteobacteria bacterium]|nr:hypothetical protein [Pseudomonadota bacterium]